MARLIACRLCKKLRHPERVNIAEWCADCVATRERRRLDAAAAAWSPGYVVPIFTYRELGIVES